MNAWLDTSLGNASPSSTLFTDGAGVHLTAAQIKISVLAIANEIENRGMRRIAFLADNSPDWAILSLAALESSACLIPIPSFFSDQQLLGVLTQVGCDYLITDCPTRVGRALPTANAAAPLNGYCCFPLPTTSPILELPSETDLVTFTSGTTGQPKGVCLSAESLWQVADSLSTAVSANSRDVHLALLPLPILLSSIVAIHASLIAGACSVLAPSETIGLGNGLNLAPEVCLQALEEHQPSLLLLVPELLNSIVQALESRPRDMSFIRFVAVGGAPIGAALLKRASAVGLPVFEGYGLSEASSVVTMNTVQNKRAGTVGRCLPGRQIWIDEDGEIFVKGSPFLGYLTPSGFQPSAEHLATGDLGTIDADGFMTISGRKSNVIVTSLGRNISPEWVEAVLEAYESIEQATVHGHGQPRLSAVIRVATGKLASIPQDLERANQKLPEYARVHTWTPVEDES